MRVPQTPSMGRKMPLNLAPPRVSRSLLQDHHLGSFDYALLLVFPLSFWNCCSERSELLAATKFPPAVLPNLTRKKQPNVAAVGSPAVGILFNSAMAAASFAALDRAGCSERSC